ncbi:MAG: GNAT family N-acetyltransferase [Traorella sp.]
MIREAKEVDYPELMNLYKSSFSLRNIQSIDCFFNHGINEGKAILCEKDDKIVASIFMRKMNIIFHNKLLKCIFLSHVAIHPDYRKTTALDECMKSVLDECEKTVLFTFVEATSFKFWENYGFQEGCIHRFYELNDRYFTQVTTQEVFEDATSEELKDIYDHFVVHFDGYPIRDIHYFERMIQECKALNERIFIVRNRTKPMGYLRFNIEGKQVKVKEIVYLGSSALLKLCKAALGNHDSIIVELSNAEKLEKLFPLAIPRKRLSIMVRCNNFPLFNKLYNSKVKTSKESYDLSKKPKYMNEKY